MARMLRPDGVTVVEVADNAVEACQRRGWTLADAPPAAEPDPEPEAPAEEAQGDLFSDAEE